MSTAGEVEVLDLRGEAFPLDELARHWDLDGLRDARRVPGGKNEHVRLSTDHGVYYLRRSYRSKPLPVLLRQLELLTWLRAQGLPVPEPLPTRDGPPVAVVAGRLYTLTPALPGKPFDPARPAHLREAGRTLARYHELVATLPLPVGETDRPELLVALRERVAGVAPGVAPDLVGRARAVLAELEQVWPRLPRCIIHGGARRGSMLFDGDRICGLLDFDSARPEVRVLDLATAVHDMAKVYSTVGAPDHKVSLDLARVAAFLSGYAELGQVAEVEAQALPALLVGKRLHRALGRAARQAAGAPLSGNDMAKIELERARLRWLAEHEGALHAACRTGGR